MYQLIHATGATNVVEAGTSFGVSTIYLALAVAQVKAATGKAGTVIATEKETEKAQIARQYWEQCGPLIQDEIDLREGDLLQTLKTGLPDVDLLLLDSKTSSALGFGERHCVFCDRRFLLYSGRELQRGSRHSDLEPRCRIRQDILGLWWCRQ